MANTRLEKYKIYRESIVSGGSTSFKTPEKSLPSSSSNSFNTTSSLPLDQVMGNYQEESEQEVVFYKKRRNKRIITISIVSLLGVILVGLLIFLLIKAIA